MKISQLDGFEIINLVKELGIAKTAQKIKSKSFKTNYVLGYLLERVGKSLKEDVREQCIECNDTTFSRWGIELEQYEAQVKIFDDAQLNNLKDEVSRRKDLLVERGSYKLKPQTKFKLNKGR